MLLSEISPTVRFARVEKKAFSFSPVAACDHRFFCCLSGDITVCVGGKDYRLTKGTAIYWRSGMTYQTKSVTYPIELAGVNFDFTRHPEISDIPIPPALPASKEYFPRKTSLSRCFSPTPPCLIPVSFSPMPRSRIR